MKIRTLIVDDEMLARDRLRALLETETDIEIIDECADGVTAATTINEKSPDLVFLDVQMPELDGFGVLETVKLDRLPVIVFVTAHDKFALKAFEVHAVDYLMKPFDRDRFKKALQRAREQVLGRQSGAIDERLTTLMNDLKPEPKHKDRIAVKSSGRVVFVKTTDIDWIEAADNYVELHVGKESHLHRDKISNMETQLASDKFIRISRSAIVNIERIKELQPAFHGDCTVILHDGTKLTLSRTNRDKLRQLGLR